VEIDIEKMNVCTDIFIKCNTYKQKATNIYYKMAHYDFHNNYVTLSDMFYESHKSVIEKVCLHLEVEPDKIDDIVEKFIGQQTKVKTLRDPKLPKRPKSAYILFCQKHRGEVKESLPNARLPQIAKTLGKLWSECSDEERKALVKASQEDKQRYVEEMDTYNNERVY